jgi:uroporphyrinogen-III synthase
VKLWITRSEPGASRQAAELTAAGYPCWVRSVLTIEPLSPALPKGAFERCIFVSEHGVHCGLPRLQAAAPGLILPAAVHCLAIGPRTASALSAHGIASASNAARSDSEALLADPRLRDVKDLRVLLVAGVGGRTLIEDTLRARGASVERFECYRRVSRLDPLPRDAAVGVTAIIVGSGEALLPIRTLWREADGSDDVLVLVPSSRVAGRAVELGFGNVHDCGAADVSAVLRALREVKDAGSE